MACEFLMLLRMMYNLKLILGLFLDFGDLGCHGSLKPHKVELWIRGWGHCKWSGLGALPNCAVA